MALSLLSVKIRESGNKVICQASGPGEDEYMSPSLIQFVWEYVSSGSLICPADCEVNSPLAQTSSAMLTCVSDAHTQAEDCKTALNFFGFPVYAGFICWPRQLPPSITPFFCPPGLQDLDCR